MNKENNIVYVQTKNGIFKCYKSEQMHKPIYYPIESKTNGYIDYNDVEKILTIEDLYQENKKYKEVIDRLNFIKNRKNQGASQENINKMAIEFVNNYLKEVSE